MNDAQFDLAPGEELLLAQRPQWSKAAPPIRCWLGKGINVIFAAGFGLGTVWFLKDGQAGWAILLGTLTAFSVLLIFSTTPQQEARKVFAYAVTNKRVIVLHGKPPVRTTIAASGIRALQLRRNGAVDDITITFGQGEEDYILLPAAPNAAEFEKLIAQHFLKDARHEQAHSTV